MGALLPAWDATAAAGGLAIPGSCRVDRAECVLIAKAVNFGRLRRHVGRARAETLATEMATRIEAALSPDRIAITGRDSVEIVLSGVADDDLSTATTSIVSLFVEPLVIDGEELAIELVLGGAVDERGDVDELRLIEEAERAVDEAALTGAPVLLSIGRVPGELDRATLSHDLMQAIRDDELLLQYQPKVHLRRRQVTSLEALIRWQHPTLGLMLPGTFVPLTEETGDIAALTLWVIGQVIADQQALAAEGHRLPVFVNISGVLLADAEFVARACDLVREAGVAIGFEITETSVIRDPQVAIANLNAFAAIGIALAIDDYGAGLSSLAYLKQLPARELKIDKLFVTQLTSSHRDPLIVRSTIDLAHALEMEVVAEGVETQAALALLSVMGCDMAQGYFISRPIGLSAMMLFLDEHRNGWQEKASPSPFAALMRRA